MAPLSRLHFHDLAIESLRIPNHDGAVLLQNATRGWFRATPANGNAQWCLGLVQSPGRASRHAYIERDLETQ